MNYVGLSLEFFYAIYCPNGYHFPHHMHFVCGGPDWRISKCVVGNVFCAAIDCTSDITMFCLATGVKAGMLRCCSGVERVDYGALCVFSSQSSE